MISLFKVNSWKGALIHLAIIVAVGIVLVLIFFFQYLPSVTNHGETITVPDVRGVKLSDLGDFLDARQLKYEVTKDSGFSATQPPLSVLKQFPQPNSKVKENRKIYVTLNAEHPPMVRMPKLVGGSVKNAQLVLKTYDLELGKIEYVPDLALNYILEQRINGRELLEGEKIPKGSTIDLVVGDGLGSQILRSPNLIGLDAESAQIAIVGSGLKVGNIEYAREGSATLQDEASETTKYYRKKVAPGAVFQQSPPPGETMELEQTVDLWVYQPDSVSTSPTLLDQE